MEELTERQKVVRQAQRQVADWQAADSIRRGTCPNCEEDIDTEVEDGFCEYCGQDYSAAVAEHGQDGPQVLEVQEVIVSRLRITYGGPSSFIEYDHSTGRATFFSSYFGDGETVELLPDEAAAVSDLFGLEAWQD